MVCVFAFVNITVSMHQSNQSQDRPYVMKAFLLRVPFKGM